MSVYITNLWINPNISRYMGIYQNISEYILKFQNILNVSNLSEYILIYLNTSEYIWTYLNISEHIWYLNIFLFMSELPWYPGAVQQVQMLYLEDILLLLILTWSFTVTAELRNIWCQTSSKPWSTQWWQYLRVNKYYQ